jgi:hypothetical protein
MKSSEQMAKREFDKLAPRDKWLILAWRERGYDWCDSLLNSGVLSSTGWRVHPEEAARAQESDRIDELILRQYMRSMPTDDALRRREAAEHEAAHAIVAQALGVRVRVAHVLADGSGGCLHEYGTPIQTATIALAGEIWIGTFRSLEFPRGPAGCKSDRRAACSAVGADDWELKRAYEQCHTILKENRAIVLALADRIDADGHAFL